MTYYAYDNAAFGQLHRIWGNVPQPVEFEYNTTYGHLFKMRTYRSGDFTQATWPGQPPTPDETRWDRDGVSGLLTRKVYPDSTQVKYVYNDYSALKSRDWARGPISIVGETSYTYDPDTGQLTNIDYTDSTPDIAFTYDRLGRIATVTDALGTHTFTYNAKLQLESEEIAGSIYDATITRTYQGTQIVPGRYDGFGIGMDTGNWNDDFEATYLFDTHGRLNHVSGTALPNCGVRYTYLTDSDLIERIEYEANLTTFAETVRSYEATRDVLTSVEDKWGTTVISKYDYAYDDLARRQHVVNGGKAFVDHSEEAYSSYSYTIRNELERSQRFEGTDTQAIPQVAITGQDFTYTYDLIGNRMSSSIDQGTPTTYTANNVNQYTSTASPAETFVYDSDGNMTGDGDFTYAYDAENRLVSATDALGIVVEFTYDYRGRRVQKIVRNSSTGVVSDNTRFVYDGWNVVLELDGNNEDAILRKYAWGLDLSSLIQSAGGIGGLLAVEDTDGTVATNDDVPYLYFYDGNGNVGQLMDFSDTQTLSIAAHYEYDPYGNLITGVGSYWQANPFRFSTKYFDEEIGLYYYGYRYYAPRLGRWLNRDPIEERGGRNLYRFVFNNAISWIDPDGYAPQTSQSGGPTSQPNEPGESDDGLAKTSGESFDSKIRSCQEVRSKCVQRCFAELAKLDHDPFDRFPRSLPGPILGNDYERCASKCTRDEVDCFMRHLGKPIKRLDADSPECDKYECDDEYFNTNARCFCKCAGNSKWSTLVRGCLREMYERGVDPDRAHQACYVIGDLDSGDESRPIATLAGCFVKCGGLNPF
ncbi:MAG: hypothetical protein MI923_17965 [Phycisphaerales bacterium]|nr:hypothetical protein [Phycisphaerales bacterium]